MMCLTVSVGIYAAGLMHVCYYLTSSPRTLQQRDFREVKLYTVCARCRLFDVDFFRRRHTFLAYLEWNLYFIACLFMSTLWGLLFHHFTPKISPSGSCVG